MALEMAYVIKKFYPYFWHKFKFPVENDIEIECEELVKNLREAVWVHRIVSLWHWRLFLKIFLSPMISSPETYVSYIFFMISSTIKDLPNIHESFMTSCSLVTAVAAYVYDSGYQEFLEYCPDILMVLFEENYSKEFDRVQIRDHLITCHYSDAYKIVEKKTNGNPFADVVNQLDFVTEIKEIIKSEISVSEDAAVHRHTMEVIERFRTRTYRNHSFIENREIILKRNASSQTVESLQNTEEQRKTESGQRISTEHMELIGLKISQSLPDFVKRLLDVVENVVGLDDTEVIRMKRGLSLQSEKPLQDVESPRIFEAEQISTITEAINLNHSSSYETEQRLEELEMLGKRQTSVGDTEAINLKISSYRSEQSLQEKEKQCISEKEETVRLEENQIINLERISSQPERPQTRDVEDTEDVDLTNSSSHSEEQSIQNVEKSRILNSKESTSMLEETEAMISKRNLPFQMEQSFEEDLERPRIPERVQSLSVTEETGDINLKQISSFQTEQSLQNDMNKLRISDNEQNTPVKSPFNNFNSDDGTSQFEAENLTEENYLDKLHNTEAVNQNTAPQSKQKSKKKKPKYKKTSGEKEISVKVEYSKAVDSKISSFSEEQSLQNIEKSRDTEASLPVPSKQEVLYALLFLIQKLNNSFGSVCDLLDVPMNN